METKFSSISKTTALLLLLGVVACSAPKPSAAANITNLQTETLLGIAKFTETKKSVMEITRNAAKHIDDADKAVIERDKVIGELAKKLQQKGGMQ